MREYDATSIPSIMRAAWDLEIVDPSRYAEVAAKIIYHDLMRGPWWFQALVWAIRRRSIPLRRLQTFYEHHPALAADLITETARHIRHGRDREDKTSKGGLSQREMHRLSRILDER